MAVINATRKKLRLSVELQSGDQAVSGFTAVPNLIPGCGGAQRLTATATILWPCHLRKIQAYD